MAVPRNEMIAAQVGANLRRVREEHGWTQAQLAVWADVGTSTVARCELGAYTPKLEQLMKLAAALSVPLSALLPADLEPETVSAPKKPSGDQRKRGPRKNTRKSYSPTPSRPRSSEAA